MFQRTLKNTIKATGTGLYTGKKIILSLNPALPNTGIIFRRIDLNPIITIPAHVDNLYGNENYTCLIKNKVKILFIEHLMAAFAGLGIDNAIVDLNESEIPIMDGSAWPFIFLILSSGIQEQDVLKKFIKIKQKVRIDGLYGWASIEPYDGFMVSFNTEPNSQFCNHQQPLAIDFTISSFIKEISRARTFLECHSDVKILSDKFEFTTLNINSKKLRYKDEFRKHKILDIIGDLYLLGHCISGHFSGYGSEYHLNKILLQTLLSTKDTWEFIDYKDNQKFYL